MRTHLTATLTCLPRFGSTASWAGFGRRDASKTFENAPSPILRPSVIPSGSPSNTVASRFALASFSRLTIDSACSCCFEAAPPNGVETFIDCCCVVACDLLDKWACSGCATPGGSASRVEFEVTELVVEVEGGADFEVDCFVLGWSFLCKKFLRTEDNPVMTRRGSRGDGGEVERGNKKHLSGRFFRRHLFPLLFSFLLGQLLRLTIINSRLIYQHHHCTLIYTRLRYSKHNLPKRDLAKELTARRRQRLAVFSQS